MEELLGVHKDLDNARADGGLHLGQDAVEIIPSANLSCRQVKRRGQPGKIRTTDS
jgi:hypothetical protein